LIKKLRSVADIDGVFHIVGPDGTIADVDSQGRLVVTDQGSGTPSLSSSSGTHYYPPLVTSESTVVEITSHDKYELRTLVIYLGNFSSSNRITVRLYYKVDGDNYVKLEQKVFRVSRYPSVTIRDLFGLSEDVKITIQPSSSELNIVSVPYRYMIGTYS